MRCQFFLFDWLLLSLWFIFFWMIISFFFICNGVCFQGFFLLILFLSVLIACDEFATEPVEKVIYVEEFGGCLSLSNRVSCIRCLSQRKLMGMPLLKIFKVLIFLKLFFFFPDCIILIRWW